MAAGLSLGLHLNQDFNPRDMCNTIDTSQLKLYSTFLVNLVIAPGAAIKFLNWIKSLPRFQYMDQVQSPQDLAASQSSASPSFEPRPHKTFAIYPPFPSASRSSSLLDRLAAHLIAAAADNRQQATDFNPSAPVHATAVSPNSMSHGTL
ncbi:hypothetical protein B0H17DRAFT_1182310 [Mycena rosella]|uniref:Uncharacterized protein n=1 Tax=Mycena rosella TaxID=1033263 RepID=A0AAD7GBF9_MYCRO|nr:hypothetical protein B0H17DRAFT_1182310 [Mycena rosella]